MHQPRSSSDLLFFFFFCFFNDTATTEIYTLSLHDALPIFPPEGSSDWPYVIQMDRRVGPLGLPLLKPPYRRITAIDLNTGEHIWQIPFGKGPTDHPLIANLDLGPLGSVYDDEIGRASCRERV